LRRRTRFDPKHTSKAAKSAVNGHNAALTCRRIASSMSIAWRSFR
jgi:hypothetical protein